MSNRAQLFVGRLPIDIRERDVEQVFEKYGRLLRCDVKFGMYGSTGRRGSGRTGMAYAFVDYDDRRDAEDAIKYENGREIKGQSIVVEWARGPSYRSGRENYGRASRQTSEECYRCKRTGHWARDCPQSEKDKYYPRNRYRSRSRSRSNRYRRSSSRSYSRSRDRELRRRNSSDYHPKSRGASREKRIKSRSPSGSLSPAKSVSRSRSRSYGTSHKKEKSKKSKGRAQSNSQSRSSSINKSRSQSHSPSFTCNTSRSLSPQSQENDYVDNRNKGKENCRSSSLSPRKSISRSPNKENNRRGNDSECSMSRSKSR